MMDNQDGLSPKTSRWIFASFAILAICLLIPGLSQFAWLFAAGILALSLTTLVYLVVARRRLTG